MPLLSNLLSMDCLFQITIFGVTIVKGMLNYITIHKDLRIIPHLKDNEVWHHLRRNICYVDDRS